MSLAEFHFPALLNENYPGHSFGFHIVKWGQNPSPSKKNNKKHLNMVMAPQIGTHAWDEVPALLMSTIFALGNSI